MTKIFALEETLRIWETLAETGSDEKESVEGADYYAKRCPCCHYVLLRLRHSEGMWNNQCRICPAKEVWGDDVERNLCNKRELIYCTNYSSPYRIWDMGLDLKANAALVADGVEEILYMEYLRKMNI